MPSVSSDSESSDSESDSDQENATTSTSSTPHDECADEIDSAISSGDFGLRKLTDHEKLTVLSTHFVPPRHYKFHVPWSLLSAWLVRAMLFNQYFHSVYQPAQCGLLSPPGPFRSSQTLRDISVRELEVYQILLSLDIS